MGPGQTNAVEAAHKKQLADTAKAFAQRRVAAVKERLKRTKAAMQKERAAKSLDGRTLPLLARPYAMAVVGLVVRNPGLYMFCGPKGDGKTSLMEQLEEQHPFVIRVDLQNGSVHTAVTKVAAAMGYSLDYTAEELEAKAAGFTVPDIKAVQGIAEFEELLLVFEQACNELRAEGALGGHVPVLILECVGSCFVQDLERALACLNHPVTQSHSRFHLQPRQSPETREDRRPQGVAHLQPR